MHPHGADSPTYWNRARSWARANTKTYTWPKAIPPIVAAIGQWRLFNMRPLTQTALTAATIIGVYILLYGVEFLWNLLVKAPVALDRESHIEVTALRKQLATAHITLSIIGGMFERSPVTIRGKRNGRPVEEYVGVITLVFTLSGDRPASINRSRLIVSTEEWGEMIGVPVRERERLSSPTHHHIAVERVKLEKPYRPDDVEEMEPNVHLYPGKDATRYTQCFTEAWNDDAYKTARLTLTVFDAVGGEWRADLPASRLKRIRVVVDGSFI